MKSHHLVTIRLVFQTLFIGVFFGIVIQLAGAQTPRTQIPKIEVVALPSYLNGNDVKVTYKILNGTDDELKMVKSSGEYGTKITLENPQGKRVMPYAYYPLTNSLFKVVTINNGESKSFQIDLSDWFPFNEAGVYRCVLTKRLFASGNDLIPNAPDELRGRPIDVISDLFQFRVESPSTTKLRSHVDQVTGRMPSDHLDGISTVQWYEQPARSANDEASPETRQNQPYPANLHASNAAPQSKPEPLTPSEETNSSTLFSIIVVLIVVAGCLLWLLLKRRS